MDCRSSILVNQSSRISREKVEESKSGQLAKGLIEIGLLVSGFGWVVQLLVNLIQLLHDFGWTKILHRFGFN
jgi:hypothetical protein